MVQIDILITDEIREAANLEAANSILHRNGVTVTRLDFEIERQCWITDTDPPFFISAEILYQIALPIARRMAEATPLLGPKLHAADVVADVRANPTGKSTDELIAACNDAVENRDKEGALRAIAELMHS